MRLVALAYAARVVRHFTPDLRQMQHVLHLEGTHCYETAEAVLEKRNFANCHDPRTINILDRAEILRAFRGAGGRVETGAAHTYAVEHVSGAGMSARFRVYQSNDEG